MSFLNVYCVFLKTNFLLFVMDSNIFLIVIEILTKPVNTITLLCIF